MVDTGYQAVRAHDDGEFGAYCVRARSTPRPGIVLFPDVLGITDNVRDLALQVYGAGYTVLVPDLFWRIEPRLERADGSGPDDATAVAARLDLAQAAHDMTSTLAHLRALPHCTGTVGALGFGLGGTLTYAFAADVRVDGRGPDAAVSYYGPGIHEMLDRAPSIECPMMFHYGDRDPTIAPEQIAAVEAAVGGRCPVHRYDVGQTFACRDAPSRYDEAAATLAWERTLAFLADHLVDHLGRTPR